MFVTSPLYMYYGFQFGDFMGLLCVSASVCISCDFPLAFFGGGVNCFAIFRFVCFLFVLFHMSVCFLVRVRKHVGSRWEARWGGTERYRGRSN